MNESEKTSICKITKQIKSAVSDNSLILSLALIFILFHIFFENIIDKLFVNTFFNKLTSNPVSDIIFLFFTVLIIYRLYTSIKNNYCVSIKTVVISVLLFLAILYYRILETPWVFTPFSIFLPIKYIDVLLLALLSNIIIKCANRRKKYNVHVEDGFYFDYPIENTEEDTLNRNSLAQSAAKRIKNTANSKTSFAIGVVAEWGNGKTSFLNLIEKYLDGKDRIIVHFNPWLNNDEKAIITSFFDELSNKTKQFNKELANDLLQYADILKDVGNDWSIKLHKSLQFLSNNTDLRRQYVNINNAILASGRQFVIFIDDLDRLYEKEILEVLRLIRNSASFSNTVFIATYDKTYLISALKEANSHRPEFYLEKIFQVEIPLPEFEQYVIVDRLQRIIEPHLTDEDKKKLEALLSEPHHPLGGNYFNYEFLSTLRDINRFVNSFLIAYDALKNEIELRDLLNLELLKNKFLGVYNLLACDYNKFLETNHWRWNRDTHLTLKEHVVENEKPKNPNENNKTVLENHLTDNYPNVGIQPIQIKEVIRCVGFLFPVYNDYEQVKVSLHSINNPTSIDRYFHFNLLRSNLSEIEFSKYRSQSNDVFQQKIKDWVNTGYKNEIFRRFERIELFANKGDYEQIIKAILFLAALPTDYSPGPGYIGFDSDNLMKKFDYKKVQTFYPKEEQYAEFVQDLFENQPSPYSFISDFIFHIFKHTYADWKFIIPEKVLIELKLQQFRQYATLTNKFDKYLFWLFNRCDYVKYNLVGNSYISENFESDEAKKIFQKCATRLIDNFLKNIITTDPRPGEDNNQYSIGKIVPKVWDSWDKFEHFLEKFDEDKVTGLSEFKGFYTQCKEVNFERYIPYTFKTIDLSDALLFSN